MSTPNLDTALQRFEIKRRRARLMFAVVLVAVLAATISILAYLRNQTRQAENSLSQLEAQAHLRWDMRTERKLDRAGILQGVKGETQRKAIGIAIDLYEQRPPIPYTWGGKDRTVGFDSSGFVAWVLSKAGVLTNPAAYWSGRLRHDLKPVDLKDKRPGDVVFYPGGACMFYLGGPDDLSLGALPGGIATGELDRFTQPLAAARYP